MIQLYLIKMRYRIELEIRSSRRDARELGEMVLARF